MTQVSGPAGRERATREHAWCRERRTGPLSSCEHPSHTPRRRAHIARARTQRIETPKPSSCRAQWVAAVRRRPPARRKGVSAGRRAWPMKSGCASPLARRRTHHLAKGSWDATRARVHPSHCARARPRLADSTARRRMRRSSRTCVSSAAPRMCVAQRAGIRARLPTSADARLCRARVSYRSSPTASMLAIRWISLGQRRWTRYGHTLLSALGWLRRHELTCAL